MKLDSPCFENHEYLEMQKRCMDLWENERGMRISEKSQEIEINIDDAILSGGWKI